MDAASSRTLPDPMSVAASTFSRDWIMRLDHHRARACGQLRQFVERFFRIDTAGAEPSLQLEAHQDRALADVLFCSAEDFRPP